MSGFAALEDDGSCGDCTAKRSPADYEPCPDCGAPCGHGYCRSCQGIPTRSDAALIAKLREWEREKRAEAEQIAGGGEELDRGLALIITAVVGSLSALLDEHEKGAEG